MKKFINNVDEILTESLTGFGDAHSEILEVKLLVPFFIGSGSLLYPLAIGSSIALSNPILNLKIALLVFSKHSSDATDSEVIKIIMLKNRVIVFLNFIL